MRLRAPSEGLPRLRRAACPSSSLVLQARPPATQIVPHASAVTVPRHERREPRSDHLPKGTSTLRVMLIEDDRTYAWLVEEMLVEAFNRDAVDVVSFGSLAAAIEKTGAVDCALVDLSLPDASGMSVIDAVLSAMPEVPVVVLTGAEDEQMALQAVERGAQDYLVKRRVDPEGLGRSVRYAIERKRAEV